MVDISENAENSSKIKINPDRIYVYPEFKKIIKMEAASKGKDIIEYTKEIVENKTSIEEIMQDWNRKFKRVENKRGFDFP